MFSLFKGQQIDLMRDRSIIFFVVILPTLLVFILGTMLANLDSPDLEIEPMTVAYFVDGKDAQTASIVEAIISEFDDVEQIEFVAGSDRPAADEELASGILSSYVVFMQPFSIEIHDGSDEIQNRAVHTIFESVARLHGSSTVVITETQKVAAVASAQAAAGAPDGQSAGLPAEPTRASSEAGAETPRVSERTFGISRSMIDYYAITMIVMMFFMGSAQTGASTLYSGRKDGSLRRTLASPLSRPSIYLQFVLSGVPYNLLQVAIVMVTTTTLFGAHYALTWQANALLFVMLFFVGFAASSVSLILGILVRINPVPIIMAIMWPLLFLSGTFSKEIFIPGFSDYLPPAIVQKAAFDLTLFGQPDKCIAVLLVSIAIILVSTAVGTALFNRKEVAA